MESMRGKEPTVLIADDESHVRALLRATLANLNCVVAGECSTGADAVRKFRELQPDLLLLDHNMPRMTGEEALAEIMSEFPDGRIIILTSVSDAESVERCIAMGATNYIRKDLPLPNIIEIIKQVLQDIRDEGNAQYE
jgi:two-component system chemotaxis response regulator CheY